MGAANAAQLCALVIQINTKYGTMKNKRFLPLANVTPSTWKALVDAAVAERSHLIAVAPGDIKKALTHELAWFARIKANHYSKTTPLGSGQRPNRPDHQLRADEVRHQVLASDD